MGCFQTGTPKSDQPYRNPRGPSGQAKKKLTGGGFSLLGYTVNACCRPESEVNVLPGFQTQGRYALQHLREALPRQPRGGKKESSSTLRNLSRLVVAAALEYLLH